MDAEEFDSFYTASFDRLAGHLYAMTGDRDEARDCVQEAFVRAWSHRRKLDRALQQPAAAEDLNADHVALVAAMRRIPEAQRRAVVLHHLCDLPVAEVAEEVGAPVGTVKARLKRGRDALLALLGEDPGTEMAEGAGYA